MPPFLSAATVLASLAISAVSVSATAFQPGASDNLAVYWGQGNAQKPLSYFCSDDTIDIIPIGFVNVFPDEAGSNGYPGTNFGNACGGFYTTSGGQTTQLLASCPDMEADIKTCQANGKKILLSLGGGSASAAYIATDASAVQFADFLWGAFGPQTDEWIASGQPRPFGDAVVDGFDFDIESLAADIPTAIDNGYAAMANEFRRLFGLCTSPQAFYLSAAPQCLVPDGHLADAISNAVFDFLFVQFYNTPQCSARAHLDSTYGQVANGGVPTDISYDTWISWVLSNSANKETKVYIGLPAAPGAAESSDYLSPTEAATLITDFKCKYPANFGGVMLWEATYSDNNQINGQSYAQNIKPLLTGCSCAGTTTTTSSVTSSSTTTTSSPTSYTTPTTPTTSTTSTISATTSATWIGSYSATASSWPSTSASPVSSPTTSSSNSTPSPSSTCDWAYGCTATSGSTPAGGVSTTTSTTTTSSTPTGWSAFGTCTSSTCKGLATGPGTSADPTTTTWPSWSANPSSSTSATLTSTWTIIRPTDWSTSTTSTSVTSVMTMTLVPVPSSVWYANTFSQPSSIPISSISLASTATASPSQASSAVNPATGASGSISNWPPASIVSPATTSSSTKSSAALPAITMMTVSLPQGATWSSDPSLTLAMSASKAQSTAAAPFATFTGGATCRPAAGAKRLSVCVGVIGLVGALVL